MLFSKKTETANGTQENIKIQVLEEKPCRVALKVQWGAPDVKKETEAVYERIQREAKMPGFRAGKIPMETVKQSFAHKAKELVVENLLSRGLSKALIDKKIPAVSHPKVEPIQFLWEQPFTFQFSVEVPPKFDPKDYKKIKIEKPAVAVAAADVDKELETMRERNARLVPAAQDAVTKDHFLIVDYDVTVDGQPLPGGKAENQLVSMTSPQTIAGFTEGLLGAKEGETKEIKVKFPEDYFKKDVAGKEGVFKVHVREVKSKSMPALDDEFAKDLGVASLAEAKERIQQGLMQKKERDQEKAVRDQITAHLLKANPIPVPESLVEEQTSRLLARAYKFLKEQGLTDQDWKTQEPKWMERCKKEAEDLVRLGYVLSGIGKEEKIELTDEEFRLEREKIVASTQQDEIEAVEKYLTEHRDQIENSLKEDKIFKFLTENAKIKEV